LACLSPEQHAEIYADDSDQQEVMGAIADMTIEITPWNRLCCGRRNGRGRFFFQEWRSVSCAADAMTRVYLTQALEKVEAAARK